MTREKEIEKEAVFRYPEMTSKFIAFIKGAKWADKTMLDRACEWIKNNKHLYKELSFGSLSTDWNKFIREFRKAMEGGAE